MYLFSTFLKYARASSFEPRLHKKLTKKRSIHVVCEHPGLKISGTSFEEVFRARLAKNGRSELQGE